MGLDWLIAHGGASVALWAILYISDYSLTILGASLYQKNARQHIAFEKSYELTPLFEKDINTLRRVSPRFVVALLATSLALWFIWASAVQSGMDPQLFEFLLGAMLLLEIAVHMRHIRNIFSFSQMKFANSASGKVMYARWMSYRLSAVEMLSFTAVYLFFFGLVGRWFFLGGAVTCLGTFGYHWLLSERAKRASSGPPASGGEAAASPPPKE